MFDDQIDHAQILPGLTAFLDPITLAVRLNPIVRNLLQHQELARQLTAREVAQRYRGTVLGFFWSFINPLLMLGIYTFVFSVIFKASWTDSAGQPRGNRMFFAMMLFAGLIPFNVFSEVAMRSPGLILGVPNYVKKVVFPLEMLPVSIVLSAIVHSLFSVAILILGSIVLLHQLSIWILLLPVAYVPLVLLCLGLSWFLASLGMYLRDTTQAIGPIVAILNFVTPIFYPMSAIPLAFRTAYQLNPMTTIVAGFRLCLLGEGPISLMAWMGCTIFTALLAAAGYFWFEATKRGFADVL